MNKMLWTLFLVCWVVVTLDLGCKAFEDIQGPLRINTKNNGKMDPFSVEVYPTRKENLKSFSEDTDMDIFFKDSNEDFDFEDDGFFSKDTFSKDSFSKSVEESRKRFMHDVSNIDQLFEDSLKSNIKDLLREDDTPKTTRDDATSKNINTTERTGVMKDDNERNVQQTTQTNLINQEADELKTKNPRINEFNSENPQIANISLFSDINRAVGSNPVAKLVSLTDVDAKNVIENGLERTRKGVSHDSHANEGLSDTEKREVEKEDFDGLNVVTEISVLEIINGEPVQRTPSSEELRLVEDSIPVTERLQSTDTESKLEYPVTVNYYESDQNIQQSSDVSKIEEPVLYADKASIDVIDDLSSILKVDPEFSDDGMDKMLSDDSDDVRDMDIILNNEYENEDFKRQKLSNTIMHNNTNINETPRRQAYILNNNNTAIMSDGEKEDPRDYRKIYHTMHKNLSNVSDVKITFSETEGDFLDDDNDEYVFNITEQPNESQENNVHTTIETTKMPETTERIINIQISETSKEAESFINPIIRIIPEILFKNDESIEDETYTENINFPAPNADDFSELVFKNEEIKVTTESYNQIIKNISDVIAKLDKDSVELVQETEILNKIVEQEPNISTTIIVPLTDKPADSTVLFPLNDEKTSTLHLVNLEQKDNIFGEPDIDAESVLRNNFNISLHNEKISSVTSKIDIVLGELEKINDKVQNVNAPRDSEEPYNNINTTNETSSVINPIKDRSVYLEEPLTRQLENSEAVTTNTLIVSSSTIKTSEKMDSIDRTVALIKQILQTSEIDFSVENADDYALQNPRNIISNTEKTYIDSESTNVPMTTSHLYEKSNTNSLSSKAAYTIPFDTSTVQIDTTEKKIETTHNFNNLKETTTDLVAEKDNTALNFTENPELQDGTYIDFTESVLISTGLVEKSDKDLNDLGIKDNLPDYQVEITSTKSVESKQNVLTLSTVTQTSTSKPNISKKMEVKEVNTISNTAGLIKPAEPSHDISSSEVESLYNAQIEEYELLNENNEDSDGKIDSSEIESEIEYTTERSINQNNKKDVANESEYIKEDVVNTPFKNIVEPSVDVYPGGYKTSWNAQTEEYESLKKNNEDFVGKVPSLEKGPNLNVVLNKNFEGPNSYALDKQGNTTIVPILRGVILNNTAEFSVNITQKDKSLHVPSYAYIREYPDITYLDTHININITWKISNSRNDSLEIYVVEKKNVFIIERVSVNLIIGQELLHRHRTNIESSMMNTSDITMGKNFTLVMDDGLRITFSNVDFLIKKYNSKLEYSVSDQRLGNFEVVSICLAVIAILAIGFYFVIVKTKRKITLREKKELAQGTKC